MAEETIKTKPLDAAEEALTVAQGSGKDALVSMSLGEVEVALRAVRVLQNVENLIEGRGKFIRQTAEKLAAGEFVADSSIELMQEFAEEIRMMKEMLDV